MGNEELARKMRPIIEIDGNKVRAPESYSLAAEIPYRAKDTRASILSKREILRIRYRSAYHYLSRNMIDRLNCKIL